MKAIRAGEPAIRPLALLVTAALVAVSLAILPAQEAAAELPTEITAVQEIPDAIPPLLQRDENVVTSDPIPTVQIDNGYVWSQTTIGTTVYAVGKFDNARAPLAPPGTSLTSRSNILAYNIETGQLLPFAPSVNGEIRAVAASPDGSRIYIGGNFNNVNGQTRWNFAALNSTTGELVPGFAPSIGGSGVYGLTVTDSTVYVGGLFTQANGTARNNLAAFNTANGALRPWAPETDRQVDDMTMDPAGQKVILAGRFSQANGNTAMRGAAAVDKETGTVDSDWELTQTVKNGWGSGNNAGKAGIWALSTDDTAVYGTGWVFANATVGNLEGTFAAEADTGEVRWVADCLGDHYGVHATGTIVYTTSHTHACSTLGLFPEQNPRAHQFVEAYTADARGRLGYNPHTGSTYQNWEGTPGPSAYYWAPDFATGITTGMGQAGLSITGVGDTISVAGEFRAVNNRQFEGIVRFSTSPPGGANDGPRLTGSGWVPSAMSVVPGRVRVSVPRNHDRDDLNLTYELRRSGTADPVAVLTAESRWWDGTRLMLEDTTATPGATHTYTVTARDGDGNTATSQSVSVVVADGEAPSYVTTVLDDSPQIYYPLGDSQLDWAGANTPVFRNGVSSVSQGGIQNSATGHSNFNGGTNNHVNSSSRVPAPTEFSTELWFRTNTTRGGKLIGYGNSATGSSSSYDRHVYMRNDGRLVFGVYPGAVRTVTSPLSYRDNQWHHVVATQSADGIALYVDGELVASDSSVTSAQGYLGFWRIGGDSIGSWPSAPSSNYFNGSIDEVAVYSYALSPAQISTHHGVGMGHEAPTAVFTATPDGLDVEFDANGSTAQDGASLVDYIWDFGDGSDPETGAEVAHSYGTSGTYAVSLTVVDNRGLAGKYEQDVTVLGPNVDPDAVFSASVNGLSVTVDASGSSDPDGTIVSYEWDWGDESASSEGQLASHTYAAPGTYTVELTVTDDRDGVATATEEVEVVHADPVAHFTSSTSGLTVNVDGSDSIAFNNATLEYEWDWGDDAAGGSGVSATHTYAEAGEYEITLTVTDSLDSSHHVSQQVFVSAEVFAGLDTFTRTVSSGWGAAEEGGVWAPRSGSATVASVSDGVGRLDLVPGATREMVLQGTSVLDGLTQVTYTLSDGPASGALYMGLGSRYDSGTRYLAQVWHRADGSMWLVLEGADGVIATQPLQGLLWNAGSTFHLATEVTGATPATIRSKVWADGDPEPDWQIQATDSAASLQSSGSALVRLYRAGSATGTNVVEFDNFTLRDLAGVEPNVPPVASFMSSVVGLTVSVDGSGSSDADGTIESYEWDFGGEATATGVTASHEFGSPGTYTVTLTVTDNDGGEHSISDSVTVEEPPAGNQPPVASFMSSVVGLTVSVDGSGSSDADGTIESYEWDFGGEATATGVTASHEFGSPGTYTVTLTVTDNDGAEHSTSEDITVGDDAPEPEAVLIEDQFEREVSNGWGTAPIGGPWTISGGAASAAAISGSTGQLALQPGSTRLATLGATPLSDGVLETEFSLTQGPETGGSYVGVVARDIGTDRYQVRAWLRPDGSVWLVAQQGGQTLAVQPLSGVTYSADGSYRMKVSVTGSAPTTLAAKFWVSDTPEPSDWQLTVSDNTASLQVPGAVGLSGFRTSSASSLVQISFGFFKAESAG